MKYLIFLVSFVVSESATSCTCIKLKDRPPNPDPSHIVIARVINVVKTDWDSTASVEVTDVLSGNPDTLILSELITSNGMCGLFLTEGKDYLVYSNLERTERIDVCDKSKQIDLERDRQIINEIRSYKQQ